MEKLTSSFTASMLDVAKANRMIEAETRDLTSSMASMLDQLNGK